MELVDRAAPVRVLDLVGAGKNDEPVRPQHAPHLVEKSLLRGDVLDRLERNHDVEAGIGEGQCRAVGLPELEIGDGGVGTARMFDRCGGNVRADHLGRMASEELAAIARPAGDVEHVPPYDQRCGEMVTMPMLVPDLARDARDETLAGEFERVAHRATPLPLSRRSTGWRHAAMRASHGRLPTKRRTSSRLTITSDWLRT